MILVEVRKQGSVNTVLGYSVIPANYLEWAKEIIYFHRRNLRWLYLRRRVEECAKIILTVTTSVKLECFGIACSTNNYRLGFYLKQAGVIF